MINTLHILILPEINLTATNESYPAITPNSSYSNHQQNQTYFSFNHQFVNTGQLTLCMGNINSSTIDLAAENENDPSIPIYLNPTYNLNYSHQQLININQSPSHIDAFMGNLANLNATYETITPYQQNQTSFNHFYPYHDFININQHSPHIDPSMGYPNSPDDLNMNGNCTPNIYYNNQQTAFDLNRQVVNINQHSSHTCPSLGDLSSVITTNEDYYSTANYRQTLINSLYKLLNDMKFRCLLLMLKASER